MVINLIKFIHLLLTLGIIAAVFYSLAAFRARNFKLLSTRINKILLPLGLFAALTGTLLIYPKHFTFHTPWIQAAYLLITVFAVLIGMLILLRNHRYYRVISCTVYLLLIVLLIGVVHDAVTKTTFLFFTK